MIDVLSLIDDDKVLRLAQKLVRIPSITGQEGRRISDFIAARFRDMGLNPVLQKVSEDRFNIVCELCGDSPGPRFLLTGHQDTKWVEGMTIDPFAAEVRDGRLYGRGAVDMKSALACMIEGMAAIKQSGAKFRGRIVFASEVGEEGGGWTADMMADAGDLDADFAIVGEPSELRIELGNRGVWGGQIRVLGLATHSGVAQRGVNAIAKMASIITGLYELPYLKIDSDAWGQSSMNVQKIDGGRWPAAVPDECIISIDSRLTPAVAPEEAERQIRELLRQQESADPELRLDWEFFDEHARSYPAVAVGADSEIVRLACHAVERARGVEPQLSGFTGYSVAGKIAPRGTPVIILGPGSLEQAHTADEWIAVDQLGDAARIYAGMALEALQDSH
jgi:acetylornithine deacetylase/succinyl-diaminopimelate desuccinylase